MKIPTRSLLAASLALPVSAQPTPERTALETVQKACQKTAWLQGLEFATVESQNSALGRQMGGLLGGGDREVSAKWTPDTVELVIDEDHEVVVHRGRMVAREGGAWVLRKDRLASGAPLPFVFDPGVFFDVLARFGRNDLQIARDELQAEGDGEVRVITLTVEDRIAHELVRTGALPEVEGAGVIAIGLAGRLGGRMPELDMTTDIALFVDPVSHLVQRIRVKSYKQSEFGGNVVFQVQGGGGVAGKQDEEQDVEETDAAGQRRFEQGLPVRKVTDDQSSLTFTVRLSKHDMPIIPSVDEQAKKLLRMR